MSDAVFGWLFGGWSFGASGKSDDTNSRHGRRTRPAPEVEPSPIDADDAALMARIRDGDETAFEVMYRAYYDPAWRIARSIIRSGERAQDVTEDVFLWLWLHRTRWTADARGLATYIHAAVRHRALDLLRREARRDRFEETIHEATETFMGGPILADGAVMDEDARAAFARAMAELPERQRTALLLRVNDGMRFPEIGAVLGVTDESARRLVLRATEFLRTRLSHLL